MDSFMETQYHEQTQQQQQQSSNTGNLLRFRSAPSSLLNDYITPTITKNSNSIMSYDSKPPLRLNLNNSNNGNYSSSGSNLNSSQLLPPQYPKNLNICNSNSSQRSSSNLAVDETVSDDKSCLGGVGLNLNRQCSSPAGFFNQLDAHNGYTVMRGRGNLRVGGGTNGETSTGPSRLSISSHLPQIPEIGNESIKEISPLGLKFRNRENDARFDSANGFSFWTGSGSESSHLSENGAIAVRPNVLSHHLSLPKTSAEMAAVDNLMHFPDMVPCKVRAKRGFATHPRSIAERVRRNRISERMRKLQDLVPNMDKQTNTADMLDLAVEYIKELQQQHKVLISNRAKCSCGNNQHSL